MEKPRFSDAEIAYIISEREKSELQWDALAEKYNDKFNLDRSVECVKKAYHRYKELFSEETHFVNKLKQVERQRKANRDNSKENKVLVDSWMKREDILDAIRGASKAISKIKSLPKPPKLSKDKKPMTLELLISDVHVGKLTDTFNNEVCKRRCKQISDTLIKEVERAQVHYNVERIVIAFIGDLIENASMHGVESRKASEFGNAKQTQEALTILHNYIVAPIAALGIKIECIGVTGNHDRDEDERTFFKPGEENLSWIIYNTMKMFSEFSGLKNVSWAIPIDPYYTIDVYGETVCYEHYDNVKGDNLRKGLEGLLAKRTNQLNKPIHFLRGGHFHEPCEFGVGKLIVNGSVPGNDSYSNVLGYNCEPTQTLNFYIKREKGDRVKRITSFYKRMLIQLD